MAFVALLDANVIYPAALRDVLLSIAEAGICQIRWSPDILDEMQRNVAARAKAPSPEIAASGAQYVRETMELAFPDAMIKKTAYQRLIAAMTNDQKDRHVLAAAIAGRADVIVTYNLADFPDNSYRSYGLDVQDPDTFLVHQYTLAPTRVIRMMDRLAKDRRPPMDTPTGILRLLEKSVPQFSRALLCHFQQLG